MTRERSAPRAEQSQVRRGVRTPGPPPLGHRRARSRRSRRPRAGARHHRRKCVGPLERPHDDGRGGKVPDAGDLRQRSSVDGTSAPGPRGSRPPSPPGRWRRSLRRSAATPSRVSKGAPAAATPSAVGASRNRTGVLRFDRPRPGPRRSVPAARGQPVRHPRPHRPIAAAPGAPPRTRRRAGHRAPAAVRPGSRDRRPRGGRRYRRLGVEVEQCRSFASSGMSAGRSESDR